MGKSQENSITAVKTFSSEDVWEYHANSVCLELITVSFLVFVFCNAVSGSRDVPALSLIFQQEFVSSRLHVSLSAQSADLLKNK